MAGILRNALEPSLLVSASTECLELRPESHSLANQDMKSYQVTAGCPSALA